MDFLNSLARSFIRSAVNQVGRDGGKVISNRIYKNSHSTPIRITGSEDYEDENYELDYSAIEDDRIRLTNLGFEAEIFHNGVLVNMLILLGSFVLPIGFLYWLIIGLQNLFKNKTSFYKYEKQSVYKVDRRYTTGKKHAGYKNVKIYSDISPFATKSERVIYVLKGVFGLITGITQAFIWYTIFFTP